VDPKPVEVDTFFARQPIFDQSKNAIAYELLYRAAPDAQQAMGDPGVMSAHVAVSAMLGMDMRTVTEGRPAFLNVTRDLLVGGIPENIDPKQIVLEVLETIEPDAQVVEACRQHTARGFTLALDDYTDNDARAALLPFAGIVKLDVLDRSMAQILEMVRPLREWPVRLVAERVETEERHKACLEAGFEWFQGFFYRKPELMRARDLRPEQLRLIEAMQLVQDPETPDTRLGTWFKGDPTLAYKVLRMANAASLGARNIESVQHAISIVGRSALFRWLGLLLAASFNGGGGTRLELLREALVRARTCELLASSTGPRQSGHLFIVGLFSRIEALLGVPSSTLADRIGFPPPVMQALVDGAGPYAPILRVVEACEDFQWDSMLALSSSAGLRPAAIPAAYTQALEWAQTVGRGL